LETTAKRKEERAEVFVAPVEKAAPTVEERLKKKRSVTDLDKERGGAEVTESEKRKKRKKKERRED
jgi:ribosomal RNA assembly protein